MSEIYVLRYAIQKKNNEVHPKTLLKFQIKIFKLLMHKLKTSLNAERIKKI